MTPATFAAQLSALSTAPAVAYTQRSGFIESVHHGIVAITGPDGQLRLGRGEVDAPMFPRSANKPMQAVAMLRHGLDLEPELIALASASHSGEPFHLDGARRILAGAGLSEADLQNTPDLPIDPAVRNQWIREGRSETSIAQNCSGKHAAMLATCVANDWPIDTYRDPEHPLQRAMADTLADLAGEPVTAQGIDGCGAPVMALSTAGVARAFGRLATADPESAEGRVTAAVSANPEWIAGTDRDVTALIRGVQGSIAKDGAEAVYAIGLPDGTGIALKIADGGQRARPVVAAAALRWLGYGDNSADDEPVRQALSALEAAPILGHGEPVGAVYAIEL